MDRHDSTPQPHYHLDPYRRELDVEVLHVRTPGAGGGDAPGPYALLSDTVCYPEGGGQPADRGALGDARVIDVQKGPDGLRHFFEGELEPGPATLRLDWGRRFDHMQQHTAQHLLTAVAADRFGWPTTSFHLGAEVCDIEIDASRLSDRELRALEDAVAAEVRAARPVSDRCVAPSELEDLRVRSRGLPDGHTGEVRLVEIEGIDLAACGGTHLRTTAEIESVSLLGVEPMRGGLRLRWVAGGRVRRRLGAHEARNAELRGLLGTEDAELAATVRFKLQQIRGLEGAGRSRNAELARLYAVELAASPDRLVERHFPGHDVKFLGQVGRALCGPDSDRVAFLTAENDRGGMIFLAAGGRSGLDLEPVGPEVAAELDGRGGGSAGHFQGKVNRLGRRETALERVRQAMADESAGGA
ncbi:MAG: alanyl-tRNA editing protein [Acidobacteriota bacterium]